MEQAFRLALGRLPTTDEARLAGQLVADHGLVTLCRAVVNLNELAYLD